MKNENTKKMFLSILALKITLVALLLPLNACAKMEDLAGVITMTTKASEVSFTVAGAKDINIDWGDGKKSNANDAERTVSGGFLFSRDYSGTIERNITIFGNVTSLDCAGMELTALDVSKNTALEWLSCGHNLFTTVDVSKNTALTHLNFGYGSQITTLDVSKNTALKSLYIIDAQLKSLDVSTNTELRELNVRNNQLTTDALNDLFKTLTDKPVGPNDSRAITTVNNPGTPYCDHSIAEKKGWIIINPNR